MQKSQNTYFNYVIGTLRIKPQEKSRIFIFICHLVLLVVARLVFEVDMKFLDSKFINGYREGDRVLYISIYD